LARVGSHFFLAMLPFGKAVMRRFWSPHGEGSTGFDLARELRKLVVVADAAAAAAHDSIPRRRHNPTRPRPLALRLLQLVINISEEFTHKITASISQETVTSYNEQDGLKTRQFEVSPGREEFGHHQRQSMDVVHPCTSDLDRPRLPA
jgi:hypothetical protein